MKKLCAALMFCLVTFTGSICSAKIIENQVALGSVRLGWPIVQVENTLGNPTGTKKLDKNHVRFDYGGVNNFTITFNKKTNMVEEIFSGYKNGMPTPNGIGIGSKAADVVKTYGQASAQEGSGSQYALYYFGDRSSNLGGMPAMQFTITNDAVSAMRLFIK